MKLGSPAVLEAHMLVGQDLFVLYFDPPEDLDRLLVDQDCPRNGPAVLLYADSINIDQWRDAPREPQKALWTEVAIGYGCEFRGAPATAFHYPWLMLSRAYGDPCIAVADVDMSRFHNACPAYDGPARGRRCEASALTPGGDLVADLEIVLDAPAPNGVPSGLMRWVNRVRYPDVVRPGSDIDLGLHLVWADDLQVADVWTGKGRARFGAGMGWCGEVGGEAWKFGALYRLTAETGSTP